MGLFTQNTRADLMFYPIDLDSGGRAIFVEGEFALSDDLTTFNEMVSAPDVKFVSFNSRGGNIVKAMELGRAIRQAEKDTIQLRRNNCESACSLAFFGGVYRGAEAGSIGVHRSSLPENVETTAQSAVESVQVHIAAVTSYMLEMGIDPSLLELTLQYSKDDIRYLSSSEMLKYSITLSHKQKMEKLNARETTETYYSRPKAERAQPDNNGLLDLPKATHAKVRHAKGSVPLKNSADRNSANKAILRNGDEVKIITDQRPWFKVWHGGKTGYMHVTWLWIQNYEATKFDYSRFIQIKSFDNLSDTQQFVQTNSLPVEAYLASNKWFAVVLDKKFKLDKALNIVQNLKKKNIVPEDSFVTLGNTYVRKVCCN